MLPNFFFFCYNCVIKQFKEFQKMKKLTLSIASIVALSTLSFAGGDIEPEPTPVPVPTPAPVVESDLKISANMTIASKYVWRGQDQANSDMAIQGGIDVEYKGFYLGVWGSNVGPVNNVATTGDSTIEIDVYGGYAGEVAGIGFDIGAIAYLYPGDTDEWDDVTKEVYLGVSKEIGNFGVGAKVYYDFDNLNEDGDEGYYTAEFSASLKTIADITLAGTFGMDNMAGHVDDYYFSVGASKTFGKFDLGIAYHGYYNNAADDTVDHIVASISTSF
jgi:uncharacterized protein (TIGR02001 family)